MKYPSVEFETCVAAAFDGTATDDAIAELHGLLDSDASARDEYLWQVELHAHLASATIVPTLSMAPSQTAADRSPSNVSAGVAVAAVALILAIGVAIVGREAALPQVAVDAPAEHSSQAAMAGIILQNVRFAYAQHAPIIVGTGRKEPIPLGAHVPYDAGGDTLHVWDWSKGQESRVLKDVRAWAHQRFIVSPDGRYVVWAEGRVLDLQTGGISKIDLGGEYLYSRGSVYSHDGEVLRRIQDLQFSPDGGRLAILVSNVELRPSTHQLRLHDVAVAEEIQVVEFPSEKLLCRFPAGDTSTLRIGFSVDGERIVSKTPPGELRQQIVERSATTGDVMREYVPFVEGHAYAIALSPNGERLAVYDGVGALLIWDTTTGVLLHRVDEVRRNTPSAVTVLRFSPDGRYIALNGIDAILVADVEAGELIARPRVLNAKEIQWSPDGRILTAVSGHMHGGGGMMPDANIYPAVESTVWQVE